MNGIIAAFILSLASTNAAPTPQEFYSQAYHTQSLYPNYNIYYQSFPTHPYSALFPQSAYVQQPLLVSPPSLNSSELRKIGADCQATVETIIKENEKTDLAIKLNQKVDTKVDATTPGSISAINPFITAGKTSNGADCIEGAVHKENDFLSVPSFPLSPADRIFGPEVGEKYEIHYPHGNSPPALPYLSSYSGFSAHPALPAYSDFSAYAGYPVSHGNNPSVGFSSGGFGLTSSNGNGIEGAPTSSPGSEVSTTNSIKGDVSSYPAVGSDHTEVPSTTVFNEISNDSDPIGSPPSIDGPGILRSKAKRAGQGKKNKKSVT